MKIQLIHFVQHVLHEILNHALNGSDNLSDVSSRFIACKLADQKVSKKDQALVIDLIDKITFKEWLWLLKKILDAILKGLKFIAKRNTNKAKARANGNKTRRGMRRK